MNDNVKIGDKYQYWEYIKKVLEDHGVTVQAWSEISYGLQFAIDRGGIKGLLRIYDGKKGLRLDTSQIRDKDLLELINRAIDVENHNERLHIRDNENGEDPQELIGIDESGKGDYFGPLVIAGVFVDRTTSDMLRDLRVADSKKLSDHKIRDIAHKIKQICPYDIVIIGNDRYNKLYKSIGNLNQLLAWGHARVLENLLSRVECSNALSDQFGRPELIENALMKKGKTIDLQQRHRAEENIAVAAASILARYKFIVSMDELKSQYGMEFPKGASSRVLEAGIDFIGRHGKEELPRVAKLHFKTTDSLLL